MRLIAVLMALVAGFLLIQFVIAFGLFDGALNAVIRP